MFKTLYKDLLQPPGRTTRPAFCLGFVLIVISVFLQGYIVSHMQNSLISFWIGLIWLCLNIYMIYALYARRLHDIGLSVGLWFAMVFVSLLTIGFTYWGSGGGDYMSALMADKSIVEDEAAHRALVEKYQADLSANASWARWVNLLPAAVLTLFCAIKTGQIAPNKYGNPPEK